MSRPIRRPWKRIRSAKATAAQDRLIALVERGIAAVVVEALIGIGRAPASAGPRRLAPLRTRPALGVSVGEQQSHYCDTEQKTDRAHGSSPSLSFRAANAKGEGRSSLRDSSPAAATILRGAGDGCQSVFSRSRAGGRTTLSVLVVTKCACPIALSFSIHHQAGLDCNQYYHLLWLPDYSGRKTEQCAELRGEPSRGFGVDRPAGYRFAQGRSADRAEHSPSPPQRSQPKCPRL